ncbi:20405_t:CDS:2, partial [Racocetra persica]
LYEKIYNYHKSHNGSFDLALDVGTGTGQAANVLSDSFNKVYGIDLSPVMLQNAICKPNIQYLVGRGDDLSYFKDSSIDLLTVAGAFHWIDLKQNFFQESHRVLKPNGTLAIWAYKSDFLKNVPIATKLSGDFRFNLMGPYFDKGSAYWNLSQYGNYLRTMSGYANYLEKNPNAEDPVDELISNIKEAEGWNDDELLPISFCSVLILAEKKP